MSYNQSRAERSESSQYRKSGRSGSSAQPRNFSGGSGKGGGTAPPPSSASANPSLTSNRSFKKSSTAQGGQSRVVGGVAVKSDSNNASAASARTLQNGSHLQPPVHADAPVTGVIVQPTTDMPTQKSTRAVPMASSSQPAASSSDSAAPATPAKAPGDASRQFPFQFGSINPGFMNGMQIPARTNSAPPNLDEQQRDQARHDSSRAVPTIPIPSVPKQQAPRKDVGAVDQSNSGDAYQIPKPKRDVQVSSAPPVNQTQKAPIHPIPGVSMPMPFHQPQVPVQFGGPNPQIQSQSMAAPSLPMPMSIQLPMGNASQMQQPLFVSPLQPHIMQPQGVMHQSHSLNFPPQMAPQLPPQLGNLGMSIGPQFAQQQAGKFGGSRIPVKITHPDTHEELRLDKRADKYIDGGLSGARSHPIVPQSQPITSVPPAHSISYYPNSFNPGSLFYTAPSSVPLSSTLINPSSQAPRFSYPVSQGPQTVPLINPSTHTSYSSKNTAPMPGITEPSSFEQSRDGQNAISAPSASVQVTIKPATGLHAEKIAESLLDIGSLVEKGESSKFLQQAGDSSSIHIQRDAVTLLESSLHQPKPGLEPSSSLPVSGKQSTVTSPVEGCVTVVTNSTEKIRETSSESNSIKDPQKNQIKKGHTQLQHQVPGQCTSVSSLHSQSIDHADSFSRTSDAIAASKTSSTSLSARGGTSESSTELLSARNSATTDTPECKTDSSGRGSTLVSSESFGASAIDGTLDPESNARQNDSSPQDEPMKLGTTETKEQGEIMLDVRPQQNGNSSDAHSKSVLLKDSGLVKETEANSVVNLTSKPHEVGSKESSQKDLELVDHCKNDVVVAEDSVISFSLHPDAENSIASISRPSLSTSNGDDKTSTSDAFLIGTDSLSSRQAVVLQSVLLDEGTAPVSVVSSVLEPTLTREEDGTDDVNAGLISLPEAYSTDKPVVELNRSKSNVPKGKKKRKEFLQKADALGTTADLYMAYKGPEEKKETIASLESTASTSIIAIVDSTQDDVVSDEKGGLSKGEPDDWEVAADISVPKLETVDDGKQVHGGLMHHGEEGNGGLAKKYSRDFLLKFSDQCADLPEAFEISSDMAEALMVSTVNASRESYPSPGRTIDRASGGARLDRRGSGIGDDDKWNKLPGPLASGRDPRADGYGGNFRPGQGGNFGVIRNPRAQSPSQHAGGILSGPMQGSHGGVQRNTADSDRWLRVQKGLIPSPHNPMQVMHKAEKKYEVGKVSDEEQAKQRQLKAILNKLTPQNFDRLFDQVKAVNIDNADTLTGVISQIFDKALMEPTFCEMYANFCCHLSAVLPDFGEDNEKITFKRLLLNKCQEEFERGEREEQEADRAAEEGEVKQSPEEREEKRILARRRMLGNIRLIGELYKKRMLTERIMHECITKLLGQYQTLDEENIEALCKLMSTIGEMIDRPKAKEHMDAYFDMMAKLSNNMKLSSRVRFMLRDSIDLRKNKWQQRRKVDGPKKIEDVHKDAAEEKASRSRGQGVNPSVRNRQQMDFGPRGSTMLSSANAQMGSFRGLPTQPRGYGAQDARMDDRHSFENRIPSIPLPQRPIFEDSITLGPQGGLARGMSFRGQPSMPNIRLAEVPNPGDARRMPSSLNGYGSVSDRTVYCSREEPLSRVVPDRFGGPYEHSIIHERNVIQGNREPRNADCSADRSLPTSPSIPGQGQTVTQNVDSDKVWSEEQLHNMSVAAIKEFYSARDEKEVAVCVKDLKAPSFYPTVISIWVTDSFERKDIERDLLANLLIDLSISRDGMLSQDHFMKGFESVLATLEDAVNDAPKAGEFLGCMFAKMILHNVVPFEEIWKLIYEGGEEQGRLVEIGLAAEVVGTVLETIKSENGESILSAIRSSSVMKLEKFRPPNFKKPLRLDKFI